MMRAIAVRPGPLYVEPIPQTSWFRNLRAIVTAETWKKVKRDVSRDAHKRCEICGGVGDRWPVECHEKWAYDEETGIQRLTGLIALCPYCHEVVHFGLAEVEGHGREALEHLMAVNQITEAEANRVVNDAFVLWGRRNRILWQLDLSWFEAKYPGKLAPLSR